MPDELGFLRALAENPTDDTTRLVYADWLEERADPRSSFLRLEVALNRAARDGDPGGLAEQLHDARRGIDVRWLAALDRPGPGWRLARKGSGRKVYGRAIPAFINNFSYHLVTVNAYADGAIDCWGYVDLPLFRGRLTSGWVVPRAPVGETLSVYNLGQARVVEEDWRLSADDIEGTVSDAIRELNPDLTGLLDMQGTDVEVRNGIRHAKGSGLGRGSPYRVTPEGDELIGAELPVFEVEDGGFRLVHWLIYADGLSQLGAATRLQPLEAVADLFDSGRLVLAVPEGAWVTIDGIGRCRVGQGHWNTPPRERIREAADLVEQLNQRPGAIERCIHAHSRYKSEPSPANREALREAYEAVPVHRRMFCGDMDSKDGPIRRILGIDNSN